jgi:hypothetical protein
MPWIEWCKQLEVVASWWDLHVDAFAVFWRCLVECCAVFEMRREFFGVWWAESEGFAILGWDRVFCWVVLQRSGESEGSY